MLRQAILILKDALIKETLEAIKEKIKEEKKSYSRRAAKTETTRAW